MKSLAKGDMGSSEVASRLDRAHGKNAFERFARLLLSKALFKQRQNRGFVERNTNRAKAIVEERKKELAKE